MAIRESALNAITSIATSDFVRAVTSAGASSKVTVSNLAKAIIEDYTGSSLGGATRSIKTAIDNITNLLSYKAGDSFSARSWRAMGRVINSGKGIYCWIDLGKPMTATSATITVGSVNVYGGVQPTFTGTVSSISASGNELYFVLETSNSMTPGTICLLEIANTSITLS